MSKPERGSLTTLLVKKPLGQGAPAAVPIEQAESAVLQSAEVPATLADVRTDVHTADLTPAEVPARSRPEIVQPAVRTDAGTDVPTKLLHRGRRRTLRVPWTFKLPFELREELEAVARFNDLNMTEIAVEAIERHLKHFPHPPGHPRAEDAD